MTEAIPFEGHHHANCDRARNEPRSTDPEVQGWFERAAHERFCMDHAAAVMAIIRPTCLGIAPGSAPGSARNRPRWDKRRKKVVPGSSRTEMAECSCPDRYREVPSDIAALHGLSEVFPTLRRERSTGVKA